MTHNDQPRILLVEDESVMAMALSETLESEGYYIVGIAGNGPEALALFEQHQVDLILCAINPNGDWDCMNIVRQLLSIRPVPVIYLTATDEQPVLERASQTHPSAFINMSFQQPMLHTAIELATYNFAERPAPSLVDTEPTPMIHEGLSRDSLLQIGHYLFIKENYQFVKVSLNDLLYLEANNVHTTLVTTGRKYVLRLTLSKILERVRQPGLVRIHRSYAVNVFKVDSFNDVEVRVGPQLLPLSRIFKEDFLQQFQFR